MQHWGSWLVPVLSAIACAAVLLLPIVIRKSAPSGDVRGDAWRDQLPLLMRLLQPLVKAYAYTIDSSLSEKRRDTLQDRINASGAGYLLTPAEFVVMRWIGLIVGIVLGVYAGVALHFETFNFALLVALLAAASYFYPVLWLFERGGKRQTAFQKNFPFFLDVLVLGMKAGLTFGTSVEQAVEHSRPGPVRDEFTRYLRETRTGVQRRVALDRLAARVLLPAVSNFVACVTQAEETGGSLGDTLADQARLRRQERFQLAEKRANRAPVKLLAPLLLLLFPIIGLVLGFPLFMEIRSSGVLN